MAPKTRSATKKKTTTKRKTTTRPSATATATKAARDIASAATSMMKLSKQLKK